jgi:hypothetical protein
MAKFKGLFQLLGSIGELTFMHTKDGDYVKRKNSIAKKKYKKAPEYEGFRIHGQYMRKASELSQSFRHSGGVYLQAGSNTRMYSRLNALFVALIRYDAVSPRGAFRAEMGLATEQGRALFLGFEFHKHVPFSGVFKATYALSDDLKTIDIQNFIPKKDVKAVAGATHVRLCPALLRLELGTGKGSFVQGQSEFVSLSSGAVDLSLATTLPQTEAGVLFSFLQVSFWQELNGEMYPLQGDGGTVVTITGVL